MLVVCSVCNAGEGELLAYCPGHGLSQETLEACYDGNVVDFTFWRIAHEADIDFYPPASAFPDEP